MVHDAIRFSDHRCRHVGCLRCIRIGGERLSRADRGGETPGYHSTGRSAALYTRNYGVPIVQRINAASHDFFMTPPPGFTEYPLLTPRGSLTVAAPGDEERLAATLALSSPGNEIALISAAQALSLAPVLRPEGVGAAALERGVMDMEVAALHQGYLRGLRRRGGMIACGSRIDSLERRGGMWILTAGDTTFSGRIVVNAAGAWADGIGAMAGATRLNLVPKRRTAIFIDPPSGLELSTMPAVEFIDGEAYFKPDAGKIMVSPGDQTPAAPTMYSLRNGMWPSWSNGSKAERRSPSIAYPIAGRGYDPSSTMRSRCSDSMDGWMTSSGWPGRVVSAS